MTFFEVLYALDSIRQDPRIKGVLLNADFLSWNKAQVEEIGTKLQKLQEEGKDLIVTLQEANRANYFLASYAQKIVMPPIHAASSNISPYHYEELYWKSLLDRFGITMNVIPIGDYKSYMENYAHKHMSPEFRENMKRLLEHAYQYSLNLIAENRKIDKSDLESWIENGELMGSSFHTLFEKGMVSKGEYPQRILEKIGEENIISIQEYFSLVKMKNRPKQYLALLTLEGTIEDETLFLDEVEAIQRDNNVKGVILRINSPGGSALVADMMYHAVKKLREKVPVYVSISGTAASGGYYVAVAGEKIFASPLSITGSIGVVSMIPNFSHLREKAEVSVESISKGKYADLYSYLKPLSEENYNRILQGNLGVYKDFLEVVSSNRKIETNFLDQHLAQGRVWLGAEAKEHKLIDELGGLEATIYALEQDKNLGALPILQVSKNDVFGQYLGKYRKFLTFLPMTLQNKIPKDRLWNKPIMYFPYEME
ncbi:signal peptide peptidase SppA, 67K type [Fusobacterium necrophorum subsp. funduliforme 1_1_36S]|nr:signal peptide peptidase SppA, 67K type [Fusobacterium necrophorum subsp. funduliforme 1_1_36S]